MSNLDIKFKRLTPFKRCVLQNFPFIEEDFDALTNYGLLCKVVAYLNKVIESQNEVEGVTEEIVTAFNNLYDYVHDYFENLDVQEEINNKLDEMAEDGTLSDIILDYLQYPNAGDNIAYNRLGRKVIARPHYITGTGTYIGLQGGCMDSENTYVMIQNHVDGSNTIDSEYSKITRIDVRTGEEIDSNVVEIGHGNNIAYDRVDDVYYITPAKGNVDQSAFANKIIKLGSNLNIIDVTDVDKNYDSVSCDEEGNIYVGFSYKESEYAYHVYKLNKETYEEEKDIVLETNGNTGTGQSICVTNTRIVFLNSQPNSIEVFDINGKLIKNYNIKDDEYVIGEVENISTYDGKNFIFGSQNTPDLSCYTFVQLFTTNFLTGTIKDFYRNISNLVNISYHIDINSTEWNPDGTAAKPFYCIDEVSYIIANKGTNLIFDTSGTYYCAKIEYPKMKFVRGDENVAVVISCGSRNGLEIYNGSYTIEYVTLPALVIRNSNIYVGGCTLAKSNDEYLCLLQQDSTLTIAGTSFDTTVSYSKAFFITDRSFINWGKNNQSINNLGTKEIFRGDNYNFMYPTQMWSGTVAKNGTIKLNNGNYKPFKHLDIVFTDRNHLEWDNVTDGESSRSATFSNLSTGGTGNNKIQQVMVSYTDPNIVFYKANEISFDSAGTMTVNTDPTMNIVKIFAR